MFMHLRQGEHYLTKESSTLEAGAPMKSAFTESFALVLFGESSTGTAVARSTYEFRYTTCHSGLRRNISQSAVDRRSRRVSDTGEQRSGYARECNSPQKALQPHAIIVCKHL